jgi:hypothetical protein
VLKYPYVGEYRESEFKLGLGIDNSPNQYNNPMGYELENELAERKGFEPSIRYQRIHAFQACALSHSATSLFLDLKHKITLNFKYTFSIFCCLLSNFFYW